MRQHTNIESTLSGGRGETKTIHYCYDGCRYLDPSLDDASKLLNLFLGNIPIKLQDEFDPSLGRSCPIDYSVLDMALLVIVHTSFVLKNVMVVQYKLISSTYHVAAPSNVGRTRNVHHVANVIRFPYNH
jgi:hypothetical protein